MKKNVDNEILDKIFKILVLRGYIETLDKKSFSNESQFCK